MQLGKGHKQQQKLRTAQQLLSPEVEEAGETGSCERATTARGSVKMVSKYVLYLLHEPMIGALQLAKNPKSHADNLHPIYCAAWFPVALFITATDNPHHAVY